MDGLVAYRCEHAAICDLAVARTRLRTLTLEARDGDWPTRRRLIAGFLGIPPGLTVTPVAGDPARLAGRYRSQSGREASVSLDDGWLVLDGVLWWRNRLLPRAPGVFDAESWPFRLTFDADAAGQVTRFRIDGPDLSWKLPSRLYERAPDASGR